MRIKTKVMAMLTTAALTVVSTSAFSAFAVTETVEIGRATTDNTSSDVYNNFSIIYANSLENGSAYIANTGSGNRYYDWSIPVISQTFYQDTPCKAKIGAYLKHSDFDDPSAKYSIMVRGNSFYSPTLATIDQDSAAWGWQYSGTDEGSFNPFHEANDTYTVFCSKVEVKPSTTSGHKTGADQVYVKIQYTYVH